MPDFTKKSPQNWRPPFSQAALAPTNPAFRADGMTFEAKDSRQGGNDLRGYAKYYTENPMKGGNAYGIKPVLKQLMGA